MLRIDGSGSGSGAAYSVPSTNPFIGSAGSRPDLWAIGLRNPFRNSFDRRTGDFRVADVGQNTREELNFEAAADPGGSNYGWRLREGTIATPGVGGTVPDSITGGYAYRGPSIAGADGRYFFGNFARDRVFSFAIGGGGEQIDFRDDTEVFLGSTGLSGLDSFGEDGFGRLYAVGINGVLVALVPKPGSALPMALGLAAAGLAARRRRPHQQGSAAAGVGSIIRPTLR